MSIWIFLLAFSVKAQPSLFFAIHFNHPDSNYFLKNYPSTFQNDSIEGYNQLAQIIHQLNAQSYLMAKFVSINQQDNRVDATIQPGEKVKWVKLRKGNADDELLDDADIKLNTFTNRFFSANEYESKVNSILVELENTGYPFARIRLDSFQLDSNSLTASLFVDKGQFIIFDTIHIVGNAKIKKWFLRRYLGINTGVNYNEQLVKNINSRISQLPYLQYIKPSSIYFYGTKALPILYLDNRKASAFDGIIGFAPNTENNNNKLLLTGEANLKLQNLFESGKQIELNYRSFLSNSQDLKFNFVFPYVFRSKMGLDYNLNILKQDTTYLDVRNEFGFQYHLMGTDHIRLFYNYQTTSLLSTDTNLLKVTRALPITNDLTNEQYGMSFKITRLDYLRNPRKGYVIDFMGSIGNKHILRNPTLAAVNLYDAQLKPYSIYDGLKTTITQYRFQFNSDNFLKVSQYTTLRIQAFGGLLQSQKLFLSELFRIGGIRTLKGFDEQAIFADKYLVINSEFRYLIQQNSNIMLFWNGAYYQNNIRTPILSDTPYGFGAGLNLETDAGVFSLYYAIGKAFNNPIEWSKAKVHFGFVNYF